MSSKPEEMKDQDEVAQYLEQQRQQRLHPPLQQPQPQVQQQQPKRTLKPKRKLKPRSKPKRLTLKAKSRHKKKLPGHTTVAFHHVGHTASRPHVQLQQSVPKPIDDTLLLDPDDAHVGYEDILYDG
eukprot:992099_1